ncbi:hypothetical protein ACFYZ4_36735 [Streptomyces sp. NPDC001513]|uniref:hypothetical protein n=1 Tax=Streptomyces sp. NPDC001513 TaxID=3364580 RepID=UPI0036D0359A
MRERWQGRMEAPEVRLAAAIGWLCLTDEPAPVELRAAVADLTTDDRTRAMDALPWMARTGEVRRPVGPAWAGAGGGDAG